MTLYALKPRFQDLLRPAAAWLAGIGVTANQVTLAAAGGSVVIGAGVAAHAGEPGLFLILPAWLLVRLALNALDGMMAREFGQASPLGAYLNEIGDVVSDAALFLPFASVPPFGPYWVDSLVLLAALTEMAGVLGTAAGASRRYDGPLGKSDRALLVAALALWVAVGPLPDGAVWIMPAVSLLLMLTVANRVRGGLAESLCADARPRPALDLLYRTGRPMEEHRFRTHDGAELFYRRWPALEPRRGAIVMFHRGHEHSGRMAHLADELRLPAFDILAWDARGHGLSEGERGASPSFSASVRDVDCLIDHLCDAHGLARDDVAVVGQSVGAVLIATWVHDYAPGIRAMVLASPAFRVKLYVPFARAGLALLQRLRGRFFVTSYVKARFLTHDPARIASFDADPLVSRQIAVNVLLGLYEAAERVVGDARAITVPTQLLISGADWVVHHAPQHLFYERLGSATKERHVLPGFFHDTFGERDRTATVGEIRRFVLDRFAAPIERPSLLAADRSGFTRDEADRLASPLPALSPRGLRWAFARRSVAFGARFSEGLRIGRETGFDSGSTLDYVYRDRAAGTGLPGRLIDRNYLDSIGWRGIRQRKLHVEELLGQGGGHLREGGRPVHLLDIAAGQGRYVLDAIEAGVLRPDTVLLRDYASLNVESGSRLIAEKGLDAVASFRLGDAFDGPSLAGIQPSPTLAVVSGLYELFPDNALVARSLAGLGAAIPAGGYLVYTGQPWHPQLELIARTLTSHRGGSWVMRRRTQGELDQLVAAAGFSKVAQRIDRWGIFTVSLARRDPS